ncbi:class I SAM-dependent methyltransferase [Microbacterium sp. NPDC055903]
MTRDLYSDARLYDMLFPASDAAVDFYRAEADRSGGHVLELGCGTGHKLIPIAADGHPSVGLDLSLDMLAQAQQKAEERGVSVEWRQGDMCAFDLDNEFDLVFIAGNALLHLHEADDIVQCFRTVSRHLAPGGRFAFDVFNPDLRLLAGADGVRRPRTSFTDPARGDVHVDVSDSYDAAAQVTRGTWYFSTVSEPDFQTVSIEVRSIFPQELPVLLAHAGLRLVERFGNWNGSPFEASSPTQLCICESAARP